MRNQRSYKIYQEIHRRKIVRLVLLRVAVAILLITSVGLALYQYDPDAQTTGKDRFNNTSDAQSQFNVPSRQTSAIDLRTAAEIAVSHDTVEVLQDPCLFRPEVQ
jgi:hypothetical protein